MQMGLPSLIHRISDFDFVFIKSFHLIKLALKFLFIKQNLMVIYLLHIYLFSFHLSEILIDVCI